MKGFHPTPPKIVDKMVRKLFDGRHVGPTTTVLDPGSGGGAFIAGIIRWCEARRKAVPHIVGIELNPTLVAESRVTFKDYPSVEIRHQDFLLGDLPVFDYVISNPPYVPITGLAERERTKLKASFRTAVGRFDLYLLFFERALAALKHGGRLVFITPEKFLYVETAQPLRRILASVRLKELEFLHEGTFEDLITYPMITTVERARPTPTQVVRRDGSRREATLPSTGSWQPLVAGTTRTGPKGKPLAEICERISPGIATGADSVFVLRTKTVPAELRRFAHRALAGRQLRVNDDHYDTDNSILIPYDSKGILLQEKSLGPFREYLRERSRLSTLMGRVCVRKKPWYAFHETPVLDILQKPKILCKDIGGRPRFWLDEEGSVVPRHSIYYIIPKDPRMLRPLLDYLNSETAAGWLQANCQRAANGFIRLQSRVLQHLPVPSEVLGRTAEVPARVSSAIRKP